MNRPVKMLPALAALALTACAGAGPLPHPDLPLAPQWHAANATARPQTREWWHDFHDAALDRLEQAGAADSPDIAVAIARLDQARAAARDARGAQLPSLTTSDTLARQRQSLDSGLGRLVQYVPSISRTQNEGDLGVTLGWDADLAGGLKATARAAGADAAGALAGVTAARLTLAAAIAQGWLDWRRAAADRALLVQLRALVADQAGITGARTARGDAAARDSDDAAAALAQIDAVLPDADVALTVAQNRLAVLIGRPAGSALPELAGDEVQTIPDAAEPAAGTPADLLRERPDLVIAETRLIASHARIGTALAEYWPHLNLSGAFGYSSTDLSLLGGNSANVITGAIGLRWRLFDFGRIDAEVAVARGAEREAIAAYRSSVLTAGGEVENAFVALAGARADLAARQTADRAMAATLARAEASERAGEISRIERVIVAARRIDAARAVVAARAAVASALIGCHRALGG
jgi:NodT family efflux transporter outer membrane factor (OMF) lipoprotein